MSSKVIALMEHEIQRTLKEYVSRKRIHDGIEGCECPKLIAAEKLLEELNRERN